MKKFLIGAALALPLSLVAIAPASALPGTNQGAFLSERFASDLIEVKGGHGRGGGWGRGHGFGRSHGFAPPGWSRGRKVGWRGRGCPPGHAKKGWC